MHRADGTIVSILQSVVLSRLTTVSGGTAHHASSVLRVQGRPLMQMTLACFVPGGGTVKFPVGIQV